MIAITAPGTSPPDDASRFWRIVFGITVFPAYLVVKFCAAELDVSTLLMTALYQPTRQESAQLAGVWIMACISCMFTHGLLRQL